MSSVTGLVDCYCGRRAVRRTSWIEMNPGRRFHACRDYNRGGCGFFYWEDPPMCRRARAIIPGLLRKKNEMEAEIVRLKCSKKMLWKVILFIFVVCLMCIWMSFGWCFKKEEDCSRQLNMKMISGRVDG
ncbi:hypothetical protein Sango_0720000 [Sesamum angolense]|uniref:GRF-type domain-containing protein n=1 Tax=Sesamum angolense TaxID=2727404 RepID=A0AAE1X2L2_9LAMI|nr:hypothetical protein Sango_0720000 [Sesamum angolense]